MLTLYSAWFELATFGEKVLRVFLDTEGAEGREVVLRQKQS